MSRADKRARTIVDLLATAREAFLRDGYGATSLDAIAEAAGYSKGAVYSNFKDKPTLCRAVLEDIHREKMRELAALTPEAESTDIAQFVDDLADWLRRTLGDVGWTMLEFDYAVLSRNNPTVRDNIVELRTEVSETIAGLLDQVLGDLLSRAAEQIGTDVPTSRELADLVLSTGIGLGVQRAVDPTVSVEPAIDILTSAAALVAAMR